MPQADPADTSTPSSPLSSDALYRRCDPESLGFRTTDEVPDSSAAVGQERLTAALHFGMGMQGSGYHIFAMGPRSTDKRELVEDFLVQASRQKVVPPDLCHVHNFDDPYRPCLLALPPGRGGALASAMNQLVSELEATLVGAFESEEYQSRRAAHQQRTQEEQSREFEELQERAGEKGLALLKTPAGFGFIPIGEDGDAMEEEEMKALSEERKKELERHSEDLQAELQALLRTLPARKRKIQAELRKLDREIATFATNELIEGVRNDFSDETQVLEFLDSVQGDIVSNVQAILQAAVQQDPSGGGSPLLQLDEEGGDAAGAGGDNPILQRYRVNLLVDHSETEGAPVVFEEHPTFKNLVGRIEHRSRMGALTTDFSLIRPGALHRANGGYLVLDARSLLMEPHAWEAIKRVLNTERLKIESLGQSYSMLSTVSLEPEPMDLDVKVVLVGERMIYYLLCAHDPDFGSLFKVQAEFEDDMVWDGDTDDGYARFLAGIVRRRSLRPFGRDAIARVIEEGARFAGDRERLSTRSREIEDLLQQSDYWAGEAGHHTVERADVEKAIEERIQRASRLRDRLQEQIIRETVLISTDGEAVGQVNGLSVLQPGSFSFGRPTRITARVGLGKGEIVDIEREVEMGGPIHSKGVLILKGFLTERFGRDRPLSLAASLVFEQSYGGVDGDSASAAELFALLSAIAEVPLQQSLAITGSVNQHGRIQAIGGVNEKIEGFFDICRERGLTGDQGVLIPDANVKHLMLRRDVVEAVEEGDFRVHAIRTVEEGLALFTGQPADEVLAQVDAALARMSERLKEHAGRDGQAPTPEGPASESGGERGNDR
jgi:lon-related putative ATP-dependent protease